MLRQDDGEAFFEAEKFLKRHAPDLYDNIGMNPELGEELRTEAEAQAEDLPTKLANGGWGDNDV